MALAAVIGLQLANAWGRLDGPFLDTRLHYDYDNADFGFKIRNGIRNHDLRSQFGVTVNRYGAWGEPSGKPKYYTDHPFLLKTLLQLYGRLVGVSEWATRSFSLGVAVATIAGFYWLLFQTTGGAWPAAAGAATLAALPLFALYQVCVKFETDGMLLAVWVFAAGVAFLRRGTRTPRLLYALLAAAAFLTHWTAILFVAGLAIHQWSLGRRFERARQLLRTTLWAAAAGLLTLAALMSYLQSGPARAVQVLARAFTRRAAPIPAGEWIARQLTYAQGNFTVPMLLACLPMLWLLMSTLRQARRERTAPQEAVGPEGLPLLAAFIAVTSAVAGAWLVAFRQGSFIHSYWQYWLCLPIGGLVAASVALAETKWKPWIARGLACGTILWLFLAAQRGHRSVVTDQLGEPADIEFLRTLQSDRFERLVFAPLSESALNEWFQGPLFLYYTDRPVVIATKPAEVRGGDKMLVLRFQQRELVVRQLEQWSGLRLANEKCGARICAYDLR